MNYRFFSSITAVLFLLLADCATMPSGHERGSSQGRAYAHYLSAVVHTQRGNEEEALAELREVTKLDPSASLPLLQLIRGYVRAKDYENALIMTERAIKQQPKEPHLWVVLGEIHQQLGHFEAAGMAFQRAIEMSPDNPIAYGALVELHEATNDLVGAIEVYEHLLSLRPQASGLHFQLGASLIRLGDLEGAQERLKKALALNPKLARAHFLLGLAALEEKDSRRGAAHLLAYLKSRPKDGEAMEYLATALARMERYDEAAGWLLKMSQHKDLQPSHHLVLMYLLMRQGKTEPVEELAPPLDAPALSVFFTAAARRQRGAPFLPLLKGLDDVESDLDQECSQSLSRFLYLLGEEKAGAWVMENLRFFQEHASSKALDMLECRMLMSLGKYEEAVPALEKYLERWGKGYWPHYYLALCAEELDRFEDTEKHLKACMTFRPDEPELLNFLGYLYAEKNVKLGEAKHLLEQALSLEPDSPYYLDSMGWLYYRQGNVDKAIAFIQRALYGMGKDDAVLRDHLGDAHFLKGDVPRALFEWERAHRLDPELEGLAEKLGKNRPQADTETTP
jgi:tetratricopeptide (TPR) repeat protein